MDSKYQYSSLFTSGLLSMPRPGPIVANVDDQQLQQQQPSLTSSTLARKRSFDLTEPIVVTVPSAISSKRPAPRKRPSSAFVQSQSPRSSRGSPTKPRSTEQSWDQLRILSINGQAPMHPSATLMALVSPPTSPQTASPVSNQTTPKSAGYASHQTSFSLSRRRSSYALVQKPKPAPTTPLPDIPVVNERTQAQARAPFAAIQAP